MEPDVHPFRRRLFVSNIEENRGVVNGVKPVFFI